MAVKKKQPEWTAPKDAEPKKKLMDNQDTKAKGDSTARGRKKSKMVSVWMTPEQKAKYSGYAAEHDMSLSRLIIEGLELRIKQD